MPKWHFREGQDARNTLEIVELEGGRFRCVSSYEGKAVPWQVMKKHGSSDGSGAADAPDTKTSPRQARLGTDW
jgi:hypothetical protein